MSFILRNLYDQSRHFCCWHLYVSWFIIKKSTNTKLNNDSLMLRLEPELSYWLKLNGTTQSWKMYGPMVPAGWRSSIIVDETVELKTYSNSDYWDTRQIWLLGHKTNLTTGTQDKLIDGDVVVEEQLLQTGAFLEQLSLHIKPLRAITGCNVAPENKIIVAHVWPNSAAGKGTGAMGVALVITNLTH